MKVILFFIQESILSLQNFFTLALNFCKELKLLKKIIKCDFLDCFILQLKCPDLVAKPANQETTHTFWGPVCASLLYKSTKTVQPIKQFSCVVMLFNIVVIDD